MAESARKTYAEAEMLTHDWPPDFGEFREAKIDDMVGQKKHKFEDSMDGRTMGRVESPDILVVGSSQLFKDGQVRCVPMPTPDPKDPLNLPQWRKWSAIAALCFFGALALAAEAIVGALTPVFTLEYAGIDPKILGQIDLSLLIPKGAVNLDPVGMLSSLGGPPQWKVNLLSSLPLLVNGLASFMLVPLSTAVGRRPVLLFAGVMAWTGGLAGGFSQSLEAHLLARACQGFGAGAVEALIPLIVQDMMFINERNKAFSSIVASQGFIIVGLGIATPSIVVDLGWRYIYYITSGVGFLAWVGLILLVPESRWTRTPDELAGQEVYVLRPGENRPRLDPAVFGPRTRMTEFGIFHVSREWGLAARSVVDTIRTTMFPNVLWVILVNSIFVAMQGAAGQVGSSVLLAAGWSFRTLGLAVVPLVVATPFVWLFGGYVADKISNAHARRHGGRREPESHLLSLIIPLIAGTAGPVLFGWAGVKVAVDAQAGAYILCVALFLVGFGFLTAQTLFGVYLVESYPNYAGPVLVNVSSIRLIIGFGLSFRATSWIVEIGFFKSFAIYSAALVVSCIGLPFVYLYGKRIRKWTAGQLSPVTPDDDMYRLEYISSLRGKA